MSYITIAVSKTQPSSKMRAVYSKGYTHFGENYVSEALVKQQELTDLDITWHFIGPIQSNKTTDIATHFDYVHSVDRIKIANRLNASAGLQQKILNICIQVNPQAEKTKSGVLLKDLDELVLAVRCLDYLKLVGFMCIPSKDNPILAFETMHTLKQTYQVAELSMGMSNDYNLALKYGATMIRLGTKIFGERNL